MYKILMIVPTPFFADRGCHVRILEEVRALKRLGHKVTLCTYPLGREMPDMDIRRTLPVPWYRKLTAGPSLHKFYLDLLLILKAKQCLKEDAYDLIHAHLHEGIFIADKLKKFNLPIVADLQGSMTDEIKSHKFLGNQKWILKYFLKEEKRLNNIPHKILISSEQTYHLFRNNFSIPEEKMEVIMDGVDCHSFRPSEKDKYAIREQLNIPQNRKVIVFLGLLTQYQGMDIVEKIIPKVLHKYSNTHFLIMGYPHENEWKERFSKAGIPEDHITFTGRIPYEKAPFYLNAGDIAISAKKSKTEANGKLLNYMAQGLPTITFDSAVNREILGELGIYAKYNDADHFAQCLIDTLSHTEILPELGLALRKRAEKHFSWKVQAEKIINCYASLRIS